MSDLVHSDEPDHEVLEAGTVKVCHLDPTQYRAFVQAARQQDSG